MNNEEGKQFPDPPLTVSDEIRSVWNRKTILYTDPTTESFAARDIIMFTERRDRYHQRKLQNYKLNKRNRPQTHLCLLINDKPSSSLTPQTVLPPNNSETTKVVCTTNPIERAKRLNEKGDRFRISLIISSFGPQNGLSGKAFEEIWKRVAADKTGRIVTGIKMAVHYKLDVCAFPSREDLISTLQNSTATLPQEVRDWNPADIQSNQTFKRKYYKTRLS